MEILMEGLNGYMSSGKIEIEGYYKHAVKYGFWKYYENDGDLRRKVYYRNGQVIRRGCIREVFGEIKESKSRTKN